MLQDKRSAVSTGRFFSYISSVLISVFFVAVAAFGATTISTNITTDGTLSVSGASTFTGAIYATSTLTVTGVTSFFGNVGIGTSTPGTTFAVSGGVSVTGSTTASGFFATSSVITPLIAVTGAATSSFTGGITASSLGVTGGLAISGGSLLNTSTATSTWSGGISLTSLTTSAGFTMTGGSLNITSTASSTSANGINITAGCFAISGTCVGGGGGASGWTNAGGALYPTTATDKVGVGGSTTPWGLMSVESVGGTVGAATPIFVVGDSGTSTPFLLVRGGNGNVGIGTSTPWGQLSINNLAGATNPLFVVATSTALSATTTTVFVIDSTGRVGIGGTTSPSEQLTVLGNISNLTTSTTPPILKSSVLVEQIKTGIFVLGQNAYVARSNPSTDAPQLLVFDVATRTPALIGSVTLGGISDETTAIFAAGQHVYLAVTKSGDAGGKIRIFDVSQPARPVEIGIISPGLDNSINMLFVQGRYLYANVVTAIFIYDIADSSNPRLVGVTSGGAGSVEDFFVKGDYAYVTDSTAGALEIYNIANPSEARRISTIATGASAASPPNIDVSGNYAYVGGDGTSPVLIIYDISNPYSPRRVSSIATQPKPIVAVSGRYAYVRSIRGADGLLEVFDVSNPVMPIRVSEAYVGVDSSENQYILSVVGRYAYTLSGSGAGTGRLSVFDIGGLETTSALIHSLEAGNLQVRDDVIVKGQLQVASGLNVGSGGILSFGPLGIVASSTAPDRVSASFGNRVAIGTSTPVSRLTVWGAGTQSGSILRLVNSASSTLVNILENGNVGIGTSTPFALLSINATSSGTTHLFAVATSSAAGTSTIFLISGINGNIGIGGTSTPAGVLSINNTTKDAIALLIKAAGPGVAGNVAIAVDGDDTCTTPGGLPMFQTCALGDLAELFLNSEPVEAGDVVMFDSSNNLHLKKAVSSIAKSSPGLLAGIISTSPAIVFEGSGLKAMGGIYKPIEGKTPLALSGRVPVKINLENGPIATGDPITISSTPGVGMKARESGRIIGHALESFSGTTSENGGKIVVLVQNGYWVGESVRKIAVIEELEMKDRVTGEAYCVTIANGEFQKVKGECL